jgi:hypothetical protein
MVCQIFGLYCFLRPHGSMCRETYLLECTGEICKGGSPFFVHALLSFLQTFNNHNLTQKTYANRMHIAPNRNHLFFL